MTSQKILQELGAIAFARTDRYFLVRNGQVEFRDWEDLSQEELAAVAGVEKSSTGLKIKLYDKMKALELLGRIYGLFEGAGVQQEDNGLLAAIVAATEGEVDTCDIQELQQTAAHRHDLVEPAGVSGV